MPEAVIVDAIRTPIGRAMKGTLRDVRADDLAAIPLRALVERNPGVNSRDERHLMGCGFPEGEQGYNIGRNAQLMAGIDHHVPAVTVSRFCASSLQTIRMAFHAIKAGEGDQYIAAGVECVSRGAAQTFPLTNPLIDGSNGAGYNVYISMGITAENVASAARSPASPRTSGRRCRSSARWRRATAATSTARSSASTSPRRTTPAATSRRAHGHARRRAAPGHDRGEARALKPVFKPDGTVTAGNACPLNDGAAACW